MGKAAMCIRMLQVLNTGRVYKVSELADILNTNPRNIIEYKKELDEVASDYGYGYLIETVPGRYGGYKLNGNIFIPSLLLTLEEKDALVDSFNYSMSKRDFPKKKVLTNAFSKVASNIEIEDKDNDYLVIDRHQLTMSEEEVNKRYDFLEKAINENKTIEIYYGSLMVGTKTFILDPYKLFIYNNTWFFLAWDHELGNVFPFKVNRIKTYRLTGKSFVVWKYFKPENYIDGHGFKDFGEYCHVELIASGVKAALLKERVYGKNQVAKKLDDGSYKISMDMQNNGTLLQFALSCGDEVTFLEPQWLKDKLKEVAEKISKKYE